MNAGGGVFLLLHQLNKKMAFQSIFVGTFGFDSNLQLVGIHKVLEYRKYKYVLILIWV